MNSTTPLERRHFLRSSTAAALGILGPTGSLLSAGQPVQKASPAESLVKVLYESLNEKQRKAMCFAWDHVDPKRGLLRNRIENNWRITNPIVASNFYNKDQQVLIRGIFEGMTSPDWHERFDQQLKDDVGGFGKRQSIAIFGEPGSGKFQFVLTSRHMTLRCDGDSAEHVAFGGPILYAHEGERLYEKPDHPKNVFWHQAVEANKLFQTLSRSQRKEALVTHGMPSEELVGFKGKEGQFQGCPVNDFTDDQRSEVQRILKILLEPF
ncbi:MAG: DUF3500 domain-containing protein, partial [Roseibacillus sp.]|nr:DUF3500 domain-containing protein [Roseibacillus sp.]